MPRVVQLDQFQVYLEMHIILGALANSWPAESSVAFACIRLADGHDDIRCGSSQVRVSIWSWPFNLPRSLFWD